MPKRKLTEEQVLEIKKLIMDRGHGRNKITFQEIADRYGVSGVTITYIKQGRTWRHCNIVGQNRVIRTCRHCQGKGMVAMPIPDFQNPKLPPPLPKPKQRVVKPPPLPPPPPPPPPVPMTKRRKGPSDPLLAALMQHHAESQP